MSRIEKIAEEIWTEALGFSDIPDRLYGKVRAQVPAKSFLRNGVFDGNAFAVAVQAEIREWDSFLSPHVMGTGFITNRGMSGRLIKGQKALEKEEDKWVREMLSYGNQTD